MHLPGICRVPSFAKCQWDQHLPAHYVQLFVCDILTLCDIVIDRLEEVGLPFLGAFPEDKLLRGVRLDEVLPALDAEMMYGHKEQLDQVPGDVIMLIRHVTASSSVSAQWLGGRVGAARSW
jgi:hypothetical protein